MTGFDQSRWVHRLAVLTAVATFGLLCIGGLVTSHGYGLAVPDWPNTYGYNMFFFPVSQWVGGILYEHSHRLAGSVVGLLTLLLALGLHGRASLPVLRWGSALVLLCGLVAHGVGLRQADWATVAASTGAAGVLLSLFWPHGTPAPRWLRQTGTLALVLVIAQGMLGGFRVVLLQDAIGIVHATLAQLFFALVCALALWTSPWWARRVPCGARPIRRWVLAGTALILVQLVLGAGMRHRHAGLAVPDFPAAHGAWWPATDPDAIARYNRDRPEVQAVHPITRYDVILHMAHRLNGIAVVGLLAWIAWVARGRLGGHRLFARATVAWAGLGVGQLGLGAATVWTGKSADVATLHMAVGALLLCWGALLTAVAFRVSGPSPERPGESAVTAGVTRALTTEGTFS